MSFGQYEKKATQWNDAKPVNNQEIMAHIVCLTFDIHKINCRHKILCGVALR